jgi:hypothetical protein
MEAAHGSRSLLPWGEGPGMRGPALPSRRRSALSRASWPGLTRPPTWFAGSRREKAPRNVAAAGYGCGAPWMAGSSPAMTFVAPRRFGMRKRAEALSAHDALVAAQAANAPPRRDAR